MALTTHLNRWINGLEYTLDILEFNMFAIIILDSYDENNSYWKILWNYDRSIKYYVIIISYDHWTQLKIITTSKNNNWKQNIHRTMIVKIIYISKRN